MKAIIVTGAVGTGKTTLSRSLAKELGFKYIDVNKIVKEHGISEGYDRRRKSKIINIKKLNKHLIQKINEYKKLKKSNKTKKEGVVIDSHLSYYLPKSYVDLCVVTKCELKTLKKRLKKRKYNKSKIRENLDAEIFDVCFEEAKESGHKVIAVDTSSGIDLGGVMKKMGEVIAVKKN